LSLRIYLKEIIVILSRKQPPGQLLTRILDSGEMRLEGTMLKWSHFD